MNHVGSVPLMSTQDMKRPRRSQDTTYRFPGLIHVERKCSAPSPRKQPTKMAADMQFSCSYNTYVTVSSCKEFSFPPNFCRIHRFVFSPLLPSHISPSLISHSKATQLPTRKRASSTVIASGTPIAILMLQRGRHEDANEAQTPFLTRLALPVRPP